MPEVAEKKETVRAARSAVVAEARKVVAEGAKGAVDLRGLESALNVLDERLALAREARKAFEVEAEEGEE